MNKLNKNQVIFYVLLFLSIVPIIIASPIVQDPNYHFFAEQRTILGIPHIGDVISNSAFVIVGIVLWLQYHKNTGLYRCQENIFKTFCISCVLLGLGSGYYHYEPYNESLFWDRLTMVLGFSVIFMDTCFKYAVFKTSYSFSKLMLCMTLFILSTVIWITTGYLETYVFVQFFSMFVIVVLSLFNKNNPSNIYLWQMFAFYALAKLCEHYDGGIFELTTQLVSGHTLKHIFYALSLYVFGRGIKNGVVLKF